MTTLQLIELCCPVCDNHFRSRAVEATDSPAGKRTAFHDESLGAAPSRYLVHRCDRCGFSGVEADFTGETELSMMVIDHVWNELAPLVANNTGAASEKYEAAAKVAEWRGADPRHAAELWLRAAWCCVAEEDVEAERFFQRKAARRFEAALFAFDDVPREDRALLTCLTGELWPPHRRPARGPCLVRSGAGRSHRCREPAVGNRGCTATAGRSSRVRWMIV